MRTAVLTRTKSDYGAEKLLVQTTVSWRKRVNGSTMEIFKDAQSVTGSVALQRRLRASPSSHTMIRDHVAPWRTVALHRHPDRLFNHDLAGMTHNSWLQEQLFEDSRELVSRERIGRFCVDIMVVYLPVGASSLVAPLRDVE